MKSKTTLIACALVAVAAAACSSASDDPRIGDDAAMPETDAGLPPPPPPPPPDPIDCVSAPVAAFSGNVQTLSDRTPIAGARVCVLDHPELPCATTDADGFYVLECAPMGDAAISFEAEGFASGVWLWRGAPGDPQDLSVFLARMAENTGYLSPTGVVYPDGASALVTIDLTGSVTGLTAVQRSGSGEGPFFSADQSGRIDPAATSAASADELVFFVARPWEGWSEIEIELLPPPGATCAQLDGAWPARDGAPNAVRIPIRAGWETVIWVRGA
jgi:hypothetical protein